MWLEISLTFNTFRTRRNISINITQLHSRIEAYKYIIYIINGQWESTSDACLTFIRYVMWNWNIEMVLLIDCNQIIYACEIGNEKPVGFHCKMCLLDIISLTIFRCHLIWSLECTPFSCLNNMMRFSTVIHCMISRFAIVWWWIVEYLPAVRIHVDSSVEVCLSVRSANLSNICHNYPKANWEMQIHVESVY